MRAPSLVTMSRFSSDSVTLFMLASCAFPLALVLIRYLYLPMLPLLSNAFPLLNGATFWHGYSLSFLMVTIAWCLWKREPILPSTKLQWVVAVVLVGMFLVLV